MHPEYFLQGDIKGFWDFAWHCAKTVFSQGDLYLYHSPKAGIKNKHNTLGTKLGLNKNNILTETNSSQMIERNKIYLEANSSPIRAENLSGKNISTSVHKIS